MSRLEITAAPAGRATLVTVSGDVTFDNAQRLARVLHAALDDGASHLVVDLSDVGFMDSSGLAALLRAATTIRRTDGTLTIVHDPAGAPNILRFKGVERLVRMLPDRAAALAGAPVADDS